MLENRRSYPNFKKGDRREASNYRPISILSQFDKILEKLIYSRITNTFTASSVARCMTPVCGAVFVVWFFSGEHRKYCSALFMSFVIHI